MSAYARLGVRTVINCSGSVTRLGGAIMPPEVVEAMVDASKAFVDMNELLDAAGKRIAELTGVEAAYVTAGAAAGLTVATAACVAGTDPAKIARLPDTRSMKNEVVIHRQQRMNFDHAIRNAGVTLVDIGWSRSVTYPWELEEALTERTAAVAFVPAFASPACLPLETVAELAHKAGVPVIVDAAAELPPVANLRKFNDQGADLVAFSGGKAIRGPQATGFILGRRDLIEACALNSNPNHNTLGRPMKVGKEEIVGLVAALERYVERDHEADFRHWHALATEFAGRVSGLPDVTCWVEPCDNRGRPVAQVYITLGADAALDAAGLVKALRNGEPSVQVMLTGERITINPEMLEPGEEQIVAARLAECLKSR